MMACLAWSVVAFAVRPWTYEYAHEKKNWYADPFALQPRGISKTSLHKRLRLDPLHESNAGDVAHVRKFNWNGA
jgi:hypothetical protein